VIAGVVAAVVAALALATAFQDGHSGKPVNGTGYIGSVGTQTGNFSSWAESHVSDVDQMNSLLDDSTSNTKLATASIRSGDTAEAKTYGNEAASSLDKAGDIADHLAATVPTGTTAGDATHKAFTICGRAYHHSAKAARDVASTMDTSGMDSAISDMQDCSAAMTVAHDYLD
jgi:hypothetical protein